MTVTVGHGWSAQKIQVLQGGLQSIHTDIEVAPRYA
jgi:hypothetical protein